MDVRRVVPDLRCADLDRAREFYAGLLGMDVAMDLGWIVTFASRSQPLAQVTVAAAGPEDGGEGPSLTVEVDDVDAAHRDAVARGFDVVYPLTDEPWGVRRFFVRDPTGAVVNVMRHLPAGPG